jgi:SAM-dependent methyltransferase
MSAGLQKENLAIRESENWRPPIFVPVVGRRGRLLARLRRFFDLQAGSLWRDLAPILSRVTGTVVDVGCGAQPYRGLLGPQVRYIGLDTDRALDEFGYDVPDVLPIGADGRWPVEDGRADVVLATETLEHVRDPDEFLAQSHRCLRPGGQLLLTVPFAARWHYIPHDYWRFTPAALRMLAERNGFSDVVVTGRGNEVTVACYKLLALLLPHVLPQDQPGSPRIRPLGLLLTPLIVVMALIANRSLAAPAGDDCLGYTVQAVKSLH